jgi:hypothetical protein
LLFLLGVEPGLEFGGYGEFVFVVHRWLVV